MRHQGLVITLKFSKKFINSWKSKKCLFEKKIIKVDQRRNLVRLFLVRVVSALFCFRYLSTSTTTTTTTTTTSATVSWLDEGPGRQMWCSTGARAQQKSAATLPPSSLTGNEACLGPSCWPIRWLHRPTAISIFEIQDLWRKKNLRTRIRAQDVSVEIEKVCNETIFRFSNHVEWSRNRTLELFWEKKHQQKVINKTWSFHSVCSKKMNLRFHFSLEPLAEENFQKDGLLHIFSLF